MRSLSDVGAGEGCRGGCVTREGDRKVAQAHNMEWPLRVVSSLPGTTQTARLAIHFGDRSGRTLENHDLLPLVWDDFKLVPALTHQQ